MMPWPLRMSPVTCKHTFARSRMLWPLRLSLSLTTLSYWLVTSRPIHAPDALVTGVWIDPLEPPDQEVAPPLTFCREKNWSEETPTTSIDIVLVNELASRLLEHVKVTPLRGFQHAPISLRFAAPDEVPRQWPLPPLRLWISRPCARLLNGPPLLKPCGPPPTSLPLTHPVVLHTRLLSLARSSFGLFACRWHFLKPCPGFCFEYEESDLTPSGVATLCEKAEHALRHTTRSRQSASFKRWKVRLRHSALHSGKEVFQHVRRANFCCWFQPLGRTGRVSCLPPVRCLDPCCRSVEPHLRSPSGWYTGRTSFAAYSESP